MLYMFSIIPLDSFKITYIDTIPREIEILQRCLPHIERLATIDRVLLNLKVRALLLHSKRWRHCKRWFVFVMLT